MEYVFGTETSRRGTVEVLKVISDRPTTLSGDYTVERKNDVEIITDSFTIVKKIRERRLEGTYYTWYEIMYHNRYVDKFTPGIGPAIEPVKGNINDTQDALCEVSEDIDIRLAEIEDALCELTEEE